MNPRRAPMLACASKELGRIELPQGLVVGVTKSLAEGDHAAIPHEQGMLIEPRFAVCRVNRMVERRVPGRRRRGDPTRQFAQLATRGAAAPVSLVVVAKKCGFLLLESKNGRLEA